MIFWPLDSTFKHETKDKKLKYYRLMIRVEFQGRFADRPYFHNLALLGLYSLLLGGEGGRRTDEVFLQWKL